MVRINHPVGSHIQGTVKHITDFGVFVGVEEGIDGLVHISDLHWTKKVKHPSELYKKGDEIEAVVLGIDVENERIALGVKQLTEDPWSTMAQRYPVGSRAKGKVTTVTDFGVFIELEEGIEGLIHVSQLSNERVDKPQALFQPGQEVEAEVTHVDAEGAQDRAQHQGAAPHGRARGDGVLPAARARRRPLLVRRHPGRGAAARPRREGRQAAKNKAE